MTRVVTDKIWSNGYLLLCISLCKIQIGHPNYFFQVKDVFYLVVIFVVLVCAWGVARFSVLYPKNTFNPANGTSTEKIFKKMLIVPFFQIFGELYVDSMENALKDSKYRDSLKMMYRDSLTRLDK